MARPERALTIQDKLELITCGVNITSGSMALSGVRMHYADSEEQTVVQSTAALPQPMRKGFAFPGTPIEIEAVPQSRGTASKT